MVCQNCGKNEATIIYTQVMNGEKKQFALCKDCARKLGIENIVPDLSMSFRNVLGDFFNDYAESMLLPSLENNTIKCKNCGMTYEDFINNGMFGCEECYDTFQDPIDSLLKNLHGTTKHVGRGINNKNAEKIVVEDDEKQENNAENKKDNDAQKDLQQELEKAIREERYEDAAKIRDKIKKEQNKK